MIPAGAGVQAPCFQDRKADLHVGWRPIRRRAGQASSVMEKRL